MDGRRGIAAGERREVHREIGWQITGLSPSMREDVAANASDGERAVEIDSDELWSAYAVSVTNRAPHKDVRSCEGKGSENVRWAIAEEGWGRRHALRGPEKGRTAYRASEDDFLRHGLSAACQRKHEACRIIMYDADTLKPALHRRNRHD